jgi:hypothetical protein
MNKTCFIITVPNSYSHAYAHGQCCSKGVSVRVLEETNSTFKGSNWSKLIQEIFDCRGKKLRESMKTRAASMEPFLPPGWKAKRKRYYQIQ